jgi:hypothetical protein
LTVGQIVFVDFFLVVFGDELIKFVEEFLVGDIGRSESFGNGFALK